MLRTCMSSCAFVLLPVLAGMAAAQETFEDPSATEEVTITSSSDQSLEFDGLSAVLALDRDYIDQAGVMTVGELLEQLPINNGGTFNDRDALSSALGSTGISFRGLGPNSVLILINGRPAVSHGFAQAPEFGSLVTFVDLNNIPLAAVERLEVLKESASAIYGSDAMAGVINIVLRNRSRGTSLELRRGSAGGDGAVETGFNALSGWGLSRTDIQLILTHTDREQLNWSGRSISASANTEDAGGVDRRSLAASNFWLGDVGSFGAECAERNSLEPVPGFSETSEFGVCLFDPNSRIVVPSVTRSGAMLLVGHELTPNFSLTFEGSFLTSEAEGRRDPSPWTQGLYPAANPWNPFNRDVLADYRFTETGQRIDTVDTDNSRIVLALSGRTGEWDWELSTLQHESSTHNIGEGYLSADLVADALNGIDLNENGVLEDDEFLNLYSSASNPNNFALTNSLTTAISRHSVSKLRSSVFRAARSIRRMAAGDLMLSLGTEYRESSIDDRSDPLSLGSLLAAANSLEKRWKGYRVNLPLNQIDPYAYIHPVDIPATTVEPTGFASALGSQSTNGVFGQLKIPVLPELDMQLALRYEDIVDFGADTNSRVAFRYGETRRVRTRASWSQGFRAPSPGELYRGPATKLQASWDPKRCPQFIEPWIIPELAGGCIATSFVTTTWGNPDLTPEESESASAGIEVDVFDHHELGIECWQVDVHNKILTAQTAWMIANEDRLPPGSIVRYAPELNEPAGYPGGIRQINLLPLNFGRQEVEGCDIDVDTTVPNVADGVLQAQLLATHMASNRLAFGASDPLEELAGTYGYPKNRANMNLTYRRNTWQAGLFARWIDGFDEAIGPGHVSSHIEWDAQFQFAPIRATTITIGIENLLDEPPPFSASSLQGFPVEYYDMRGRFIYMQLSYSLGTGTAQGGRVSSD